MPRLKYEQVFLFAFILLIAAAIVSYFDPLEVYRQYRDTKLKNSSETVSGAIAGYVSQNGRPPWVTLGNKGANGALAWTSVTSPGVGICEDEKCFEKGVLVKTHNLGEDFKIENPVLNGAKSTIYVGRVAGSSSKTYVCFLPQSKEFRKTTSNLYKIDLKTKIMQDNQSLCNDNVTWRDQDVCYYCATF